MIAISIALVGFSCGLVSIYLCLSDIRSALKRIVDVLERREQDG